MMKMRQINEKRPEDMRIYDRSVRLYLPPTPVLLALPSCLAFVQLSGPADKQVELLDITPIWGTQS